MIVWITGLSGSGKSSIGRLVWQLWKQSVPNTAFVDGDEVRRLFSLDNDASRYTLEARREVANRFVDLCAWLDRQEFNVVCCTISLFPEIHERNRRTFSRYFEVYIDVPMEILRQRDKKGLYQRALTGEEKNVVGMDIPFIPPVAPHLIIDNSMDLDNLSSVAAKLLETALAS